MAVSANTLFHFTEKDRLKNILLNGFLPSYSLEDLSNATPEGSPYSAAHTPMVCFCDLVFSQIKKHIDFYGNYGIGLRKDSWGQKKRNMSDCICSCQFNICLSNTIYGY